MRRSASADIREWAGSKSRLPLVVRGARQVGKSWLVESFAREHFGDVATVNLERLANAASLLRDPSPQANIATIEAMLGKPIVPGRTLLFLDEIQASPELFGRLRYFKEELPDLHVVAAGSLLDFALAERQASMPVGRVSYLHLGPMSFPEFVGALAGERTAEFLRTVKVGQAPPAALHQKLLGLVRDYALVGGMPAVVEEFRTSRSLLAATRVQSDLLATYRDDFSRYGTRVPTERLRLVMDSIARQVGSKFRWSAVDRSERAQALRPALEALCRARISRRVRCSHGNGVPLGADLVDREFKVAMVDTGLLHASLGLLLQAVAQPGELVHEGPLAEHLVGQMLADLAPRFVEPELWYWARHRQGAEAEVDFLIQHGTSIVPIEVKAGRTGSLRSLHQFMVEKGATLAVRISATGPQVDDVTANLPGHAPHTFRLLSVPFYLVGELPRLLDAVSQGPAPRAARRGSGSGNGKREAPPPRQRKG